MISQAGHARLRHDMLQRIVLTGAVVFNAVCLSYVRHVQMWKILKTFTFWAISRGSYPK